MEKDKQVNNLNQIHEEVNAAHLQLIKDILLYENIMSDETKNDINEVEASSEVVERQPAAKGTSKMRGTGMKGSKFAGQTVQKLLQDLHASDIKMAQAENLQYIPGVITSQHFTRLFRL